MIFDHYLIIHEWLPNFNFAKAQIDNIAIQVRFFELLVEYQDHKCLFSNRIGKITKVDFTTNEKLKGKYARVYVSINLNNLVIPQFRMGNANIKGKV